MRKNLFDGDSYKAEFARIAYRRLISRHWVTYAEIMSERLGRGVDELPANLSNCDGYGELKKIVCIIKKVISEKVGRVCFEEEGNNRNKRFRYIGENNDPLADMRNAKVINNLRQYWRFCQDSAGFFPISWLEYFFKDCQDLLDIKSKRRNGEQVVSASIDRTLTNIEYLPVLYEAIVNKQVIEIKYKPYVEKEETTILFHPHYLKEYNGRWYLFGHAVGKEPENGYNIALDRIQSRPCERSMIDYQAAPKHFYDVFFRDIVGVSHQKNMQMEHIIIRAHTPYIYKLMDTKPIHHSYVSIKPFGEYEDGVYAEFSVDLEPNNEFVGLILQMGAGLEVVSPVQVRDILVKRVQELADLYLQKG